MTDIKKLYTELLKKGLTPKDAAKQAQSLTGLSAVTGKPIDRSLYGKFSKRTGKVLGQYDG